VQGDPADSIFDIQEGSVKVVVPSWQGKEAVVGILEPGQFFGEECLNGHPPKTTYLKISSYSHKAGK
jgi:CRP/FNR family cyclic AMP-dependent transcriptional regulator